MTSRQQAHEKRGGFTLVELIVVIAIIAVLAGILVVALSGAWFTGRQAQNTHDIRQLEIAVQAFKTKYGIYPPSKIYLAPTRAAINTGDGSGESLGYLTRIWPRLSATATIDWSGGAGYAGWLDGDQCLVFFLGGIPDQTTPGCLGFGTDPTNPTNFTNGSSPPLFDFAANRLFKRAGSPFYSYMDIYGNAADPSQPFVYFSSGKRSNGYEAGLAQVIAGLNNVRPYQRPAGRYLNPNTFQIISAGPDRIFAGAATGLVWTPSAGQWAANTSGHDDQSNFSGSKLGAEP